MDLDQLLFWVGLIQCIVMLAIPTARGWKMTAAGILVAAPVLAWLLPGQAAWAVAGLWIALLLVPTILARLLPLVMQRQLYTLALGLATVVAVLHPLDGWPGQVTLVRGMRAAARGATPRALILLRALAARSTPLAANAAMHVARLSGDWTPLLAPPPAPLQITGAVAHLRALVETGRVAEALAFRQRHAAEIEAWRGSLGWLLAGSDLALLAGAGERRGVEALLAGTLRHLPAGQHVFWRAVVEQAAGGSAADGMLAGLAADPAADLRDAAARLRAAPRPPVRLDPDAARRAAALAAAWEMAPRRRMRRPSLATALLVLANVAMFVVEMISGGAEDDDTLFALGALWPPSVLAGGQWWRLGSALFLHFGVLHLTMNMVALGVLGPQVERIFGWLRFLAVYLVSGLASTGGVVMLTALGWTRPELLVGASGAIMGLVGALLAWLVRLWIAGAGARIRGRLMQVLFVLLLQGGMDQLVPQISAAAHAFGALGGLLVAFPLLIGRQALVPTGGGLPVHANRRQAVAQLLLAGVGMGLAGIAAWLTMH